MGVAVKPQLYVLAELYHRQSVGVAGTGHLLSYLTDTTTNSMHTLYYTGSGELNHIVYPYGGHLRWSYRDFTYVDGRTVREVSQRFLKKDVSAVETVHTLYRDDAGDAGRSYHDYTVLADGASQKVWWFSPNRRIFQYAER
ncbi:MAG: hypothetical protein WKF37_11770, partial [Bryobacteraceae bacterium]